MSGFGRAPEGKNCNYCCCVITPRKFPYVLGPRGFQSCRVGFWAGLGLLDAASPVLRFRCGTVAVAEIISFLYKWELVCNSSLRASSFVLCVTTVKSSRSSFARDLLTMLVAFLCANSWNILQPPGDTLPVRGRRMGCFTKGPRGACILWIMCTSVQSTHKLICFPEL